MRATVIKAIILQTTLAYVVVGSPSAVHLSLQTAVPAKWAKEQANAHEAVMRFLQGIRIQALPEGKKLMAETQWVVGAADRGKNFYSRPDYTEITSVFASLFDTDTPPIKGYKELFDMKAVTQSGATRSVKFLVIAYKDATSDAWKVFKSSDNAGDESALDLDRQVDYFKARLGDTRYSCPRENYAIYGQWLFADGRLSEARSALRFASTASTVDGDGRNQDDPIRDLQIRTLLVLIDKITAR